LEKYAADAVTEAVRPKIDPRRLPAFFRRPRVRVGAVVAIAAAVGLIIWLIVGGSGGGNSTSRKSRPVAVSISGLHTLAVAVPSPIYWVGPVPGVTYELTNTQSGRVYIRYLPAGVNVGSHKPYLTIATYPLAGAYAATQRAAAQKGAVRIAVQAGAIAFYNKSRPVSVYFAQQGSDNQVEIYDPSPARARSVVAAGRVQAVVDKSAAQPTAASVKRLRTLAATLNHPVYWLGEKPGYTYELTQTASGRIFIRYLPKGVAVGASKPYLTVATYPFPGALAAVERSAKGSGAVTIKLAGGGLGVVDAAYPKSVHLAYAGSAYQVEVFDPSPARARQIVASGQVHPVR